MAGPRVRVGVGLGDEVEHVEGLGALEELHVHVGGDGRPQNEGGDRLDGEVVHVEGFGGPRGTPWLCRCCWRAPK